jgi:hypothetical protein
VHLSRYLLHNEAIGRSVGFNVVRDTLRIPSTKNICLVGSFAPFSLPDTLISERSQSRSRVHEQLQVRRPRAPNSESTEVLSAAAQAMDALFA